MEESTWFSSLEDFYLPKLPWSFPVKCHPSLTTLRPTLDAWSLELCKDKSEAKRSFIIREDLAILSCLMAPLSLPDRLEKLAKYMAWYLRFDDIVDDLDEKVDGILALGSQYLSIIQPGSPLDDPLHPQLCAILKELREDMPPKQYVRFLNRARGHVEANLNEAKWRTKSDKLIDIADVLAHHRVVSLGMTLVTLVEYAAGIEIPEETLEEESMKAAEIVAVNYMCCANDLLSLPVEAAARNVKHNLVYIIFTFQRKSFQEAVSSVLEMMEDMNQEFMKLMEDIRSSSYYSPAVETFLQGLGYYASGNDEWSWITGRYHPDVSWVPYEDRQGIIPMPKI